MGGAVGKLPIRAHRPRFAPRPKPGYNRRDQIVALTPATSQEYSALYDARISKWDVINHWKTDEHIIAFMQAVLADGWPPLIAAALVDVARATRALNTDGKSPLEIAIDDARRCPVDDSMPVAWKTDADIIRALQSALADGRPEATAAMLVDIARFKGLLTITGETPRGQCQLEIAIANSRH